MRRCRVAFHIGQVLETATPATYPEAIVDKALRHQLANSPEPEHRDCCFMRFTRRVGKPLRIGLMLMIYSDMALFLQYIGERILGHFITGGIGLQSHYLNRIR